MSADFFFASCPAPLTDPKTGAITTFNTLAREVVENYLTTEQPNLGGLTADQAALDKYTDKYTDILLRAPNFQAHDFTFGDPEGMETILRCMAKLRSRAYDLQPGFGPDPDMVIVRRFINSCITDQALRDLAGNEYLMDNIDPTEDIDRQAVVDGDPTLLSALRGEVLDYIATGDLGLENELGYDRDHMGRAFMVTGGMSFGDVPTDVFDTVVAASDLQLFD